MKVLVSVTVIDGPRQVTFAADVDGGNPYGQHPVIGALEKAMAAAPKIISEAVKS